MNGSGEQDPPLAEPPPGDAPSPGEETALRFRDVAPSLLARPAAHPGGPPTDALDEDRIVVPSHGVPDRPAVTGPPAPFAHAPAPGAPRLQEAAPELDDLFVPASFDRVRRSIGVLLRDDPTQAEDITQEAFVIAYERRDRVSAMDRPLAYVITVAWRLALRWLRDRKRKREAYAKLPPAVEDGSAAAEGVVARLDLARAFLRLSHAHQEVLALSMSGLDPQDIASVLGVPPGTVRTRLFRARNALAALLEEPPEGQS